MGPKRGSLSPSRLQPGVRVKNTFIDICDDEPDNLVGGLESPQRRNISAPPSPTRRRSDLGFDSDEEEEDDPNSIPHYQWAADGLTICMPVMRGIFDVGDDSDLDDKWSPLASPKKVPVKAQGLALGNIFNIGDTTTPTVLGDDHDDSDDSPVGGLGVDLDMAPTMTNTSDFDDIVDKAEASQPRKIPMAPPGTFNSNLPAAPAHSLYEPPLNNGFVAPTELVPPMGLWACHVTHPHYGSPYHPHSPEPMGMESYLPWQAPEPMPPPGAPPECLSRLEQLRLRGKEAQEAPCIGFGRAAGGWSGRRPSTASPLPGRPQAGGVGGRRASQAQDSEFGHLTGKRDSGTKSRQRLQQQGQQVHQQQKQQRTQVYSLHQQQAARAARCATAAALEDLLPPFPAGMLDQVPSQSDMYAGMPMSGGIGQLAPR